VARFFAGSDIASILAPFALDVVVGHGRACAAVRSLQERLCIHALAKRRTARPRSRHPSRRAPYRSTSR